MAFGPGRYDDLATLVREQAGAAGVVIMVIDAPAGGGFSVQASPQITVRLPEMLRLAADQIEQSTGGLDPAIAGKAMGRADHPKTGQAAELSEREAGVLRLSAGGHSNKQISARLSISVKTVETYKARALEKLGIRSRVDVVRYAADQGWLCERG
jgi:DNA-binding NarL/FixJ family response regulator